MASRWTRRGTRSSSRLPRRLTRLRLLLPAVTPFRLDRCGCGMGLHTGEPVVTSEGYVGIDVHRAPQEPVRRSRTSHSSALRRGDVTAAAERVVESLNLFRTAGTESGMYEALLLAAVAIERRGDVRTSLQLQASVRTHASSRAYELSAGEVELADEGLARIRGTLPAKEFAGEWSRGEQLHLDAAVTTALKSLD
jgi:hypothetical protein